MRGRPPTIREEDLLDAARDVFRERGHGATTAEIARRAGVSEGILFYRYKSKEVLLAAVIHRETQPPEELRDLAGRAGDRGLAENLERLVEALLEAVSRAHPLIELVEASADPRAIRRLLMGKSRKPPPQRIVELVTAYLEAEMRLGRVRTLDPLPAARALFGGCIDFVRSRRFSRAAEDRGAFVRGLVDLLLHGLARPAGCGRPG